MRRRNLQINILTGLVLMLAFTLLGSCAKYSKVEISPSSQMPILRTGTDSEVSSPKLDPIARYGGYVLTETSMPQNRGSAYLWAKNIGTLVSYEAFLRRYPDGEDAKFFRDNIRQRFLPKEQEWHDTWLKYSSKMDVIEGAMCDPEEGVILLSSSGQSHLPPFLSDDLIVALRCAISGEKVGVTMNRVFTARFSQPDDPRKPPYESYETSVEFFSKKLWNTHLAYLLFEGDRMLKTLASGYDIFLQEPVRSKVPGFRTVVDMESSAPAGKQGGVGDYGRIWIELTNVRINTTEKKNVAMFSDFKLEVRSESKYAPPVRFAEHLRENYRAYGEEFPIFAEVERAARVVAIARWLVESYPDVAQKIVDSSYEDVKVYVPQVIPARIDFTHNMPHYKAWLIGGVVFPNVNKIAIAKNAKVRDTPLDEVEAKVLATRDGKAKAWEVPLGPQKEDKLIAWCVSGMFK